jgi:hypothetical protein
MIDFYSQAKTLTPETFRLSQREFLDLIPKLHKQLKLIQGSVIEFFNVPSIRPLEKQFKKLSKEIQRSVDECIAIQESIEPDTKAVNERKEKQLKKHIPFLDFKETMEKFQKSILEIRSKEINDDKNALKPGFDKIKEYIKQDPEFYRSICPICNMYIIVIKHQVYKYDVKEKKIKFITNLAQFYQQEDQSEATTKTIKMRVKIHIEKEKISEFNGQLTLLLHDGEKEKIGRDLIREVEYDEYESEELLFDENDPLARISNSQMSLEKKGDQVILQGMKYDEKRVGTFLNSNEFDIRVKDPDGVEIHSGDIIIIPLINEADNPNQITLSIIDF